MNKWNELTMKERAALIKVGVANGFRNIDDIRDQYNSFADGGGIEQPSKPSDSLFKKIVYTAMSDRAGTDVDLGRIANALFNPGTRGNYSGSLDENGNPNFNRDLIKLYLYGESPNIEEIKKDDISYKGSHNYTNYIKEKLKGIKPKEYKGDLIPGDPKVSSTIYNIAKAMGNANSSLYHNLDEDAIFNFNDFPLRLDSKESIKDIEYSMRPAPNFDDSRNIKRHYRIENGKPVIQASKLWDFTPNKGMSIPEKIASSMLTKVGTPFILRDREELQSTNNSDNLIKINNASILEDAVNSNVTYKNGDTYETLLSLPELTVESNSNLGLTQVYPEKNYMKIINPILDNVPLPGNFVTQEQALLYPYYQSDNKASGGYLDILPKPLSYGDTPAVRYDNGGDINNLWNYQNNVVTYLQQKN